MTFVIGGVPHTGPQQARAVIIGRWPQTSPSVPACRGFPAKPRWPPRWPGVMSSVLRQTACHGGGGWPAPSIMGTGDRWTRPGGSQVLTLCGLRGCAGGGLAKPSLSESAWSSQSSPWEPPALSLGLQPTTDTEAGGARVKGT